MKIWLLWLIIELMALLVIKQFVVLLTIELLVIRLVVELLNVRLIVKVLIVRWIVELLVVKIFLEFGRRPLFGNVFEIILLRRKRLVQNGYLTVEILMRVIFSEISLGLLTGLSQLLLRRVYVRFGAVKSVELRLVKVLRRFKISEIVSLVVRVL